MYEALTVADGPVTDLDGYASLSIAFVVDRILDLDASRLSADTWELVDRPISETRVKDYDAPEAGGGPAQWAESFDVANWRRFDAKLGSMRAGGAVVAFDTPGVTLLGGRRDVAALWDIRVAPAMRGRGIGRALFDAAENWARSRGCRELIIETQHVNVTACRFYASRGCEPASVREGAYPNLPDEVQVIWRKDLLAAK